ncbi:CDP-alcohol phosphatidyltransferase family protein [Nakamurella deserti]|uniref:CDP-alcohol phosphatidyltransferase family protein n=1 Tax=Nakamurella deserti TaxID=2164074 RepID=UPI000DBE23A7|nr:CDP-alcohol phosphatidyltransferase family protein [Nakamurella deserti]
MSEDRAAAAPPTTAGTDRIWTIPNLLSFVRLLGVPLLLWLILGPEEDGWAFVVLALSAVSDWADGKLARLLDQFSRLGAVLDPLADRLYILATLFAFVVRGILPWWVAVLIVGRDLVLALCLPVMRRHGYGPFEVHYLGKAATFCLLYALPLLLLAQGDSTLALIARPLALGFTGWGVLLYLWAGALYLGQLLWVVRNTPVVPPERRISVRSATGV